MWTFWMIFGYSFLIFLAFQAGRSADAARERQLRRQTAEEVRRLARSAAAWNWSARGTGRSWTSGAATGSSVRTTTASRPAAPVDRRLTAPAPARDRRRRRAAAAPAPASAACYRTAREAGFFMIEPAWCAVR